MVGDTLTEHYALASLHELFHADLDCTTDFGSVMCVYDQLARSAGPGSTYSRTFSTLRSWCRTTHESFATYLSLLTFAGPGFEDLGRYVSGRYDDYRQAGELVTTGLNGRFLRYHAALAAFRFCMQAPVSCIVLKRGLDHFLPRDLPDKFQPDARLRFVRSLVRTPHFWRDVIDSLPTVQSHPDWAAAAQTEESDGQLHELLGSDVDGLGTALLTGCYSALAARLDDHPARLPALTHDGHIAHVEQLIKACRSLVGGDRVEGFGVWRGDLLDRRIGAALNFERERIFLREPVPAAILTMSMQDYMTHSTPERPDDPQFHLLVVRHSERLARQFALAADDVSLLKSFGCRPTCALQVLTEIDRRELIVFIPIDSPAEIEQLTESGRVLASVSSAVIAADVLDDAMVESIATHCDLSVLVDSSPFGLIDHWASLANLSSVVHGRIDVVDTDGRWTVLWMRPLLEPLLAYLVPCSLVLAATLITYLEHVAGVHGFTVNEAELNADSRATIDPVIGRLLQYESWFDFAAPTSMEDP